MKNLLKYGGISLLVLMVFGIGMGIGNRDTPAVTTTVVELTTTELSTTTLAQATTTEAADTRLPGSSLTKDEWLTMVFIINDPIQADLCDQFEYLYLNEMVDGYRDGFNSTGDLRLNELDTLVVLATSFAIHCPESADMFYGELDDQFSVSTVSQFEVLFNALADVLDSA